MKLLNITKEQKLNIQFYFAVAMGIFGCTLLLISMFIPPLGVIDSSILIASGEVMTFVGSVFGIDYNYRYKIEQLNKDK